MSGVARWDSTNGLIYMTCGSGVEVSWGIMGLEVAGLSGGLSFEEGFGLGGSVFSPDDAADWDG